MNISERVHRLASAAAELGLTVNEVSAHIPQIALRSGVGRPTKTELTQLRQRLEWLTARQGRTGDKCPSCHAPIIWAVTAKGKTMPVDPLPHPNGNATIERTAAGGVLITIHSRHADLQEGAAYRPHFATCPSTRAKPARRLPAESECTICGRPLSPALVAAGERTHGCRSDRDPLCTACGYVLDPTLVARGLTTHLELP